MDIPVVFWYSFIYFRLSLMFVLVVVLGHDIVYLSLHAKAHFSISLSQDFGITVYIKDTRSFFTKERKSLLPIYGAHLRDKA